MDKKSLRIVLKVFIGIAIMAGFLLMCSETLPGEENPNGWQMAIQELLGFGIIGGSFWLAGKIDKKEKG